MHRGLLKGGILIGMTAMVPLMAYRLAKYDSHKKYYGIYFIKKWYLNSHFVEGGNR